jgi:hypothetical protein
LDKELLSNFSLVFVRMCVCVCVCVRARVACIVHREKAVAGGRSLIAAIIRAFVWVGGVSGVTVSANRAPGDKLYTYIIRIYSSIIVLGTSELAEHISSHSVHFSLPPPYSITSTPLTIVILLCHSSLYVINSQTSSCPPRSTTSRKARLRDLSL